MPTIPRTLRNKKITRYTTAGVTAVGAAAIALTVVPGSSHAGDHSQSVARTVSSNPVAQGNSHHPQVQLKSAKQGTLDADVQRSDKAEAHQRTVAADKKAEAEKKADAKVKAQQLAEQARQKKAADDRAQEAKEAASRAASRPQVKKYPDNLDGWIREARSIMKQHHIPGSYDGIKRNIIRESGGNPNAVNDWDINAKMGVPSKGLLQVIQPTFDRYHVKGTANKLTDPVANIVAACNYAADRYGSMDHVDSAY